MFNATEFDVECIRNNIDKNTLAKKIGMDPSTLYRKLERNGDFSRDEIQKIARLLNLSKDRLMFIFFNVQLA